MKTDDQRLLSACGGGELLSATVGLLDSNLSLATASFVVVEYLTVCNSDGNRGILLLSQLCILRVAFVIVAAL
ncbi:hypothetical protein Dimus_012915 [Dionaea muscipula]